MFRSLCHWPCSALLLAVVTAGFCRNTIAQTSSSDQSTQTVEKILVKGKLEAELPVLLAKQGTRVDVVTAAQIKNGVYVDVAQSLQTTVPGLFIAPKNGPFDYVSLSLQGSRTENVLWLVDGVRINNRLYGGTTPIDTLPSTMIERIEVLDGPQALFYGTQSVAGVINVITKDFSDTPNGELSAGGDTNDSWHVDGFFRDKIYENHIVIYASSDESRGFQPYPTASFQPSATTRNRSYDLQTVGGKDYYDITDKLRATISEQHTTGKLDDARPELIEKAYNERDEDILNGKLDYTPSDILQLFVKGYFHRWHSHYTEFDNSLTQPGALDVVENNGPWGYTDKGASVLTKVRLVSSLTAYLGYDFQTYSGSDAVLVITRHSEAVSAFFGEVATRPAFFPDVSLAAGLRFNASSFGPNATVWNFSTRWDVTHNLYVNAMIGTAFRLPTAEELFANDPFDERGDPSLHPEKSDNESVSVGGGHPFGLRGLSWEAIGFFRNVTDLIDYRSFDASTGQDVFGNIPGTVHVRGAEFVLEGSATPALSGSVSTTYGSTTEARGQQITEVPVFLAKASLDYHPKRLPFGLSTSFNYVGDTYGVPTGVRVRYGDYLVVNLAGRLFLDREKHHRIDLALNNLLGRHYATSLTQGVSDATGDAYIVPNLGQPRTFIARYSYGF